LPAFLLAGIVALPLASACSGPSACKTDADCNGNGVCSYKVGSCDAKGECLTLEGNKSNGIVEYCACDGSVARGGPAYGYRDGYASAPTRGNYPSGQGTCGDSTDSSTD
jgi:hypothetical protein